MKSDKKHIYKKIVSGVILSVVIGMLVFKAGVEVGAANSEAGSVGDPLVSKSYLDSRLDGIQGVMTKVTLSKGGILSASEGASVILYSGNGSVSGSGSGLINITGGELTESGKSLAKYNSYIFPDAATTITATSSMVVFVTGSYNITQ